MRNSRDWTLDTSCVARSECPTQFKEGIMHADVFELKESPQISARTCSVGSTWRQVLERSVLLARPLRQSSAFDPPCRSPSAEAFHLDEGRGNHALAIGCEAVRATAPIQSRLFGRGTMNATGRLRLLAGPQLCRPRPPPVPDPGRRFRAASISSNSVRRPQNLDLATGLRPPIIQFARQFAIAPGRLCDAAGLPAAWKWIGRRICAVA